MLLELTIFCTLFVPIFGLAEVILCFIVAALGPILPGGGADPVVDVPVSSCCS